MSTVDRVKKPFKPNPRLPKRGCQTIALHTEAIRLTTYDIERVVQTSGDGTRARLSDAVLRASQILDEALKREKRVLGAIRNHEQGNAAGEDWIGSKRLDVRA